MRVFVAGLAAIVVASSMGPLAAQAAAARGEMPAMVPALASAPRAAPAKQPFAKVTIVDNFGGVSSVAALNAPYSETLTSFPGLFSDRFRFFSGSAASPAYLGLADGGQFAGTTLRFGSGLSFHVANATLEPWRGQAGFATSSSYGRLPGERVALTSPRQAEATEAGVSWNLTKWAGLDLTASRTTERAGALGSLGSVPTALTRSAKTDALGLSARLGFGDGWVTTFSYGEGITQLDLRPSGGAIAGTRTLQSRAYGLSIAKHGLFSRSDALGLALTRPGRTYNDGIFGVTGQVAGGSTHQIPLNRLVLASTSPETDVELGYITTFFDGALALKANAGYQMNLAGQKGNNSLTVLTRAKINF